jgi:putative ABC transport system permease protein
MSVTQSGQVGWIGLASSLVLVGVAVAISRWQHLGLERSMIWASARAIVQLLAVGGVGAPIRVTLA